MSLALVEEDLVDLFGGHDLGLFGLLVENGVVQGFAFVEQGDVPLAIQADRHSSMAHGVGGTFGLDLISEVSKLEREAFRKNARFLPGQDASQVIVAGERAMRIVGAPGLSSKALVEVGDELGQVGIA